MPKRFTTMAGNSVRSMPGNFGSRAQLLAGASMNMRKGQEATAMRSRGWVGKVNCGLVAGQRVSFQASVAAPAARTAEFLRKCRRVFLSISSLLLSKSFVRIYLLRDRNEVIDQDFRF